MHLKFLYSEDATTGCLQYIQTKVRWRFRKNFWPSQNIWTLKQLNLFCPSHIQWREKEYFRLGAIQQLRGQNFAFFDPSLPPCLDGFYTLSVDRILHFLTPPPTCVHCSYTLSINKNRYFLNLPPSSCPSSYWMAPYLIVSATPTINIKWSLVRKNVRNYL